MMVSSKNVKVNHKRCLETSIESFTGSSPTEQIIVQRIRVKIALNVVKASKLVQMKLIT